MRQHQQYALKVESVSKIVFTEHAFSIKSLKAKMAAVMASGMADSDLMDIDIDMDIDEQGAAIEDEFQLEVRRKYLTDT